MERGVLGGGADGARVHGGLARAAQAEVPAREQQHARVAAAARLATARRRRCGGLVGRGVGVGGGRLKAARLRVLRPTRTLVNGDGRRAGAGLL